MEHRKHHYVPQCYLRNFSKDGKSLNTWDKKRSKEYAAAINNVCMHKDLYKIDTQLNEEAKKVDSLYLETEFFSKFVEQEYSKLLSRIIDCKKKNKQVDFTDNEKYKFACYMAIQWYRLPDMKDDIHNVKIETARFEIELMKSYLADTKGGDSFNKLKIEPISDPAVDHAQVYADEEIVNDFANILYQDYWTFFYIDTPQIWTSDFPMTVNPHVNGTPELYNGFGMYGAEIDFPISKDIVLVMWDSRYFKDRIEDDMKFIHLDAKGVRRYNMMKYLYAKEKVFSFSDDFSLIKFFLSTNKGNEVFMNGSPRTQISHG